MSAASYVYPCRFQEDGTVVIKARLSADDGTGAATGRNGEGYFLKQADISTITCLVYDVTGSASVATPTVTISSAVLDTPVTDPVKWPKGGPGYNFIHTLAGTNFPTGGSEYQVEYKITTTGGNVYWLKIKGTADANYTS